MGRGGIFWSSKESNAGCFPRLTLAPNLSGCPVTPSGLVRSSLQNIHLRLVVQQCQIQDINTKPTNGIGNVNISNNALPRM